MKYAHISAALVAAAVAAAMLAGCNNAAAPAKDTAAAAEAAKPNPYAELNKLPDWSGVWEPARFAGRPNTPPAGGPPAPPKLTPEYAAKYAAFQEKNKKTAGINFVTPVANCVPPGLPSSMNQPYPFEFLFTPGRVTLLIETYSMVRRIYLGGQVNPAETDASYQGTSIGHWDGDTLVVETTNILPETSPLQGIIGHSDQFKVTERMKLEDPDTLAIQTTVEDPTIFTEPYTTTSRYARHKDWHIYEYVCAQNNHDYVDDKGNAGFSLERKPGE
jgi:hypothetical protein